ncbi:fibro-slime domain-containing protein [Fibrobacter sp. UWEL]|nr:fibro-slime domain-containing protein [Fibrobacter sp. UWEL]
MGRPTLGRALGMLAFWVVAAFGLATGAETSSETSKTIAFYTPWSNTNAVLFVDGDSVATMTSLKNYCGWFKADVTVPANGLKVYFKQTVGRNYVGSEGMTLDEPTIATEIVLDSVAALTDTVWVQGYKTGAPSQFSQFPGVLGDCPLKKFPVTMFDWLHGDKGDGNGAGKNGDPANGISADFGSGGCNSGDRAGSNFTASRVYGDSVYKYMGGMVERELGANGVPVMADPFPTNCKNTNHLNEWFLPESLAVDANGNTLTNMTCRDLYISMDDEGFWLAEVSKDNISEGNEFNKGGMFLLDDFKFLDAEGTVANPYFEQVRGSDGRKHNFGFTMKIQATFEYVPGQYFDFLGDDDVWVFINNKLVVDIGGQHGQIPGAVDLDTIGQNNPAEKLVPGQLYNFHIFYVERHTGSSNFKMRTSIDLQVDASIFVTSEERGDEVVYDVWQINKRNKFACGNDVSNQDTVITGGASNYRLTGGNLVNPIVFEPGSYFDGGLVISSDSTFSINVEAIKAAGALVPGHYFLEVSLKSDPSQSTRIEIVVPIYDIPTVAFASEEWNVLGKEVSGDTLQIGDWAYATYKVNVTFLEEWATVNNYNRKINLAFSDPNIDILDAEDGKKITYVNLDSNGRATFYVHANAPVAGVTLTAKGAAAGNSVWKNLNFPEPPIPQVVKAIVHDRNGDGRVDSLHVQFDRAINSKTVLDSIQFTFGESFMTTTKFKIVNGMELIALAEDVNPTMCANEKNCGFGSRQFTGGSSGLYTGSLNSWFTYSDNGSKSHFYKEDEPIADGAGPIILSAVKTKGDDGNRYLSLTFSEVISEESRQNIATLLEFICTRGGVNETPEAPAAQTGFGSKMVLVYSSVTDDMVLPTSGDRVRFALGLNYVRDLVGNGPHANNPWAVVTGDQELKNQNPSVITVGEDPYGIIENERITQPFLVADNGQTVQQIGDSLGVQGSLVDFDMAKIMMEESQNAVNAFDAFVESRLGSTTTYDTAITSISADEALVMVFSDIRTGVVGENFNFSTATVTAIMDGSITELNYSTMIPAEEQEIISRLVQNNIDANTDTVITVSNISTVTQSDIFEQVRSGALDKDLAAAGVNQILVNAIKNGEVDEFNIESYRNGSKSLVSDDAVFLVYHTYYYTQLGNYVGGTSGRIKCSDPSVYGERGCLENKGRLFLAWNMRSDDGRLVGTGAYISRLELKIVMNGKTILRQSDDTIIGVRRGKDIK